MNPLFKERWRSCLECPFCIDISLNLYSITPFAFLCVFFFFICSFGVVVCVCGVLFLSAQCLPNELQGPELTFLLFLYLWWQDQLKLHLLTSQEPAWLLLVTEPATESAPTCSQLLLMSWEAGRWVTSEVTWYRFCSPCMAFQGLPAVRGSGSGSWSGSIHTLWLGSFLS